MELLVNHNFLEITAANFVLSFYLNYELEIFHFLI